MLGGAVAGLCTVYMGLAEAAINELQWRHAHGMPGIMVYSHQTMENDDGSTCITYDYYYKEVHGSTLSPPFPHSTPWIFPWTPWTPLNPPCFSRLLCCRSVPLKPTWLTLA